MCTVTLIPTSAGFRLVCNRDERRTRSPARPPELRASAGRRTLYPVDPDSNGAWLGVSDAGLAVCLLNANPPRPPDTAGLRSRGAIVPTLLNAATLEDALHAALSLDRRAFPPFRLLLADARRSIVVGADGPTPRAQTHDPHAPALMLTSSSLGDHLVDGPRRALFNLLFAAPTDPLHAQDVFHRRRWYDQPHLSVNMRRPDARTVSRTTVDLTGSLFTMTYQPLADDGSVAARDVQHRLPLTSHLTPAAARTSA